MRIVETFQIRANNTFNGNSQIACYKKLDLCLQICDILRCVKIADRLYLP